ncbi:MAG: anaerobic ribonucleoside triphosphate reductase [Nitrososphaeria archaeon]
MVILLEKEKEDLLEHYAKSENFDVNENANRYPGPTGFYSYVTEKVLGENVSIMPSDVVRMHFDGLIYVHKLPYSLYVPYCTGHSLLRLLEGGLRTPTIVARPARHLDSFVDHVSNYLITMQHYFSGAQAFSGIELYAGPFIRDEGSNLKCVKQQVQRLVYNLNFPSRIGMQTPFTNFTILLDSGKRLLEEGKAVIGGKCVGLLGDFVDESKLFVLGLAKVLKEGDGVGQPFTFPIPTIMATSKILYEDYEVFEAVFSTSAKMGSFYWLNGRVIDTDSVYAMCCRLSIDRRELEYANKKIGEACYEVFERKKFGGIWSIPDVTGSIGVVTVNLPRIALESHSKDDLFYEKLDNVLYGARMCGRWMRERYLKLLNDFPDIYYMIRVYMKEFPLMYFSTVGLLGLPEAAAIFYGSPRLWFDGCRRNWLKAADWMRKIVEYVVRQAREWMAEDNFPWNVEEVPGESAAAKLASIDAIKFPEVLEYFVDPKNPIYSTSIAPYYGEIDLPDRIEIESKVQKSFTGGVMMHVFLGEEPEVNALAEFNKRLLNSDLVYWSFTPAITVCLKCERSFTGIVARCPVCESEKIEIWSRIIGYYRPLRNWNIYRRREFETRKHYPLL